MSNSPYIRHWQPVALPARGQTQFDKMMIYHDFRQRMMTREWLRAPFPTDFDEFLYYCWPDEELAKAATVLDKFNASPTYRQGEVYVLPPEEIADLPLAYAPKQDDGSPHTESIKSTMTITRLDNKPATTLMFTMRKPRLCPVGEWDYWQKMNSKQKKNIYHVPLWLLPERVRNPIYKWVMAKTVLYWQRRTILAMFRWLLARCNTPGQVVRVWPATEGIITRGRAADKLASRKVKSPWPSFVDQFDTANLPQAWMDSIIAEAYLLEPQDAPDIDLWFLGAPHEY